MRYTGTLLAASLGLALYTGSASAQEGIEVTDGTSSVKVDESGNVEVTDGKSKVSVKTTKGSVTVKGEAAPPPPAGVSPSVDVPAGKPIELTGVEQEHHHTCAAGRAAIVVSGTDNTVHLSGPCQSVTVSGVDNKLDIELVKALVISGTDNVVKATTLGKLTLSGTDNRVSYKRALTGKKAEITKSGVDNEVSGP